MSAPQSPPSSSRNNLLQSLLPGPAGLLWACAAVLLGGAVLSPLWDPDLWWHLAVGQWIAENGQVPRADPFAPVGEAKPWLAHEWFFEAVLYGVYRVAREPGLVLLPALAATGTAAFCLRRAHLRGVAAVIGAPVVLLALFGTHEFWTQRPQLFTYLFLAWVLFDLQRYSDDANPSLKRVPWRLIAVVAVWANIHGAFVVAPLAAFAHLAGAGVEWFRGDTKARERVKGLALLLGALLLAGLLNPRGWNLYGHAYMYASSDWHGVSIIDWQSPDFANPKRMLFAIVVLAGLVLAGLSRGTARPSDLFLVAGFTFMALRWQRNVPLALIAAAPLCAVWLKAALARPARTAVADDSDEEEPEPPVRIALGLAHLALLGVIAVLFAAARWPCEGGTCEEKGTYPASLVQQVRAQGLPEGRGLNHFDWGGYLLWRNRGMPVYIDGRAPELDIERLHLYGRIHRVEPDWRRLLDSERVQWVLYPRNTALAQALKESGWSTAAQDEVGVLLSRPARAPAPAPSATVNE